MTTHEEKIKQIVKDAVYQSKPDAKNAMVFRDAKGHWLFEIYFPKDIVDFPKNISV